MFIPALRKNIVLISIACTIAACGDSGSASGGGSADAIVLPQSDRDNFEFSISDELKTDLSLSYQEYLLETLDPAVEALNGMPNVFNDATIPVRYEACGRPNAYYNRFTRSITLCHELVNDAYRLFLTDDTTDRLAARSKAVSTTVFALYHEIGHALENIRNIGSAGNFESVADGIGVVLSVQTFQHAAPFYAGRYFANNSAASYLDEHGNGEDRAGDMTCWVIGSSAQFSAQLPNTSASFIRAGRDCVTEYADQYRYVANLLPNIGDVVPVGALRNRSKGDEPRELSAEQARELDEIGVLTAQQKSN